MLKYKIPQIVTLIHKIPQIVTLIQRHSLPIEAKNKKDRQEWKPPNSLNLHQ